MKLHDCSDEELDKFYPVKDSQKSEFELHVKQKLKCFDYSLLKLAGDYDSTFSSHLQVNVKIKPEYCRNFTDDYSCHVNKNVEESLDKVAIVTLTN